MKVSKYRDALIRMIVGTLKNESVVGFINGDCIRLEQKTDIMLVIGLVGEPSGAIVNYLRTSNVLQRGLKSC